jgi:hypothetical protein
MSKQAQRDKEAQFKKNQRREAALKVPKHTYDSHSDVVSMHQTASKMDAGVQAGFEAAMQNQKRLLSGPQPSAKRAKVQVRGGGYGTSSDSEEESESEATAAPIKGGGGASSGKKATSAGKAPANRAQAQVPKKLKQQQQRQAQAQQEAEAGSAAVVADAPEPTVVKAVAAEGAGTMKSKSLATTVPKVQTKLASELVPEALDLDTFDTEEDLQAVGLDRLKSALMAAGLKCGGNLEQRASRLFSVKGLVADQYPAELLAGKSRKKSEKK